MPVAIDYPKARRALVAAEPHSSVVIDVSSSPDAYGNLIHALWQARKPFVIVEHDIVVRRFTIADLRACRQPWCGFPYLEVANSKPVMGLGCTRFREACFEAVPDIGTKGMDWRNVDARIAVLRESGLVEHVHQPALDHLNPKVRSR